MRSRVLSPEEIQEALLLKTQGYSKRALARKYNVGGTTIWENVFSTGKRERRHDTDPLPSYSTLRCVIFAVTLMRRQDYTSGEVAHSLQIPLLEVNRVYSNYGHSL